MDRQFSVRTWILFLIFIASGFYFSPAQAQNKKPAKSKWVFYNSAGKLDYKTLPEGDRIMDFSFAGYMGGGVKIPLVDAKIVLTPVEGDNSGSIQDAIDKVSEMPLINGFRGALLLKPGSYDCEKTIRINASGVVLRGSGSEENGSIINMTGKPHLCISVRRQVVAKPFGTPAYFADKYVPSCSTSFTLTDASAFSTGDTIRIARPVTEAWVQFMGMDLLVRDGKKQTWISGEITCDRIIIKKEKNKITVDVPLTDSYDSKYLNPPGVSVVKISTTGELSQIGIEDLRIQSPAQSVTINEGSNRAFSMSGLIDGWARNIEVYNTVNSVSVTGKRITIDNLSILHEQPTIGAAKPADLNGSGQQLFFNNCKITGDNLFFFGTGAKVTGPVVLLNCVFKGNGWIQPHQRWATGLLVDCCEVPDGGIDFMNRGAYGSGHGWTIGWAVAWNCRAKSYLNQMPPGAANWVIGSIGEHDRKAMPFNKEPLVQEGIYDSPGVNVNPKSLYQAQLSQRLGKKALMNIGY
ncbi:MAG: hypothetical protein ACTHML_14595 [Ginsengibacter sp.]